VGGEWLDMRASASAAGARCAVELELYHRTGELARDSRSPGARRFLASASLAHAWRADLWERLLPVSVGLPTRAELVVVATEDVERLGSLEGEAGMTGAGPAGVPAPLLESVYPALLAGYEHLAETANRVSEGPLALAATRSADDVRRVLAEGLALRLAGVAPTSATTSPPVGVREGGPATVAERSLSGGVPGHGGDQAP
jgi:hypothetical protein